MQSAREEVRDLERIKYVTKNFERLQGLKYTPFVVAFVFWGFALWFWFEEPNGFFDLQPLRTGVLFLVCFVPSFFVGPIERYYENRFGLVHQRRRKTSGWGALLLTIVVVASFVVGSPAAFRDDVGQPVLGVIAGLFAATFILYDWWPKRGLLTVYWLALAILAVGVCSLPLAGVLVGEAFPLLIVPLGVIFFVGSVMDHLLLIRTLKSAPED